MNDNILIRISLIIPYLLPSIPISKPKKKRSTSFSLSLLHNSRFSLLSLSIPSLKSLKDAVEILEN